MKAAKVSCFKGSPVLEMYSTFSLIFGNSCLSSIKNPQTNSAFKIYKSDQCFKTPGSNGFVYLQKSKNKLILLFLIYPEICKEESLIANRPNLI